MSRLFRMMVNELGAPAPRPDLGELTYGPDLLCRACGEHISNPHAVGCPLDDDETD